MDTTALDTSVAPAVPSPGARKLNPRGARRAGPRERDALRAAASEFDYQALKLRFQSRLLDRINLEEFALLPDDRVKSDLDALIGALFDEEGVRLEPEERGRAIKEIRDEVFGLGPLE